MGPLRVSQGLVPDHEVFGDRMSLGTLIWHINTAATSLPVILCFTKVLVHDGLKRNRSITTEKQPWARNCGLCTETAREPFLGFSQLFLPLFYINEAVEKALELPQIPANPGLPSLRLTLLSQGFSERGLWASRVGRMWEYVSNILGALLGHAVSGALGWASTLLPQPSGGF